MAPGSSSARNWGKFPDFCEKSTILAQILAISAPSNSQNDKKRLYRVLLWPKQIYLAININLSDYELLSFEKMTQIFEFRWKNDDFGPKFHIFSHWEGVKKVKTISTCEIWYSF